MNRIETSFKEWNEPLLFSIDGVIRLINEFPSNLSNSLSLPFAFV